MKLGELSTSELESVRQRFAVASDVYDEANPASKPLPGGWRRVFSSAQVPGLGDHGFDGALYTRTVNGRDQHIFAFRGMDGWKDLDDVARLAFGKSPAQLKDAYKFVKIAAEKFGVDPSQAEYVGHSMGGYLSKAIGLLHRSPEIFAFNSPGLFRDDLKGLPRKIQEEFGETKSDITLNQIERSVTSINSKFDIVTWVGDISGNTIKVSTRGRQHQLSSLQDSFNRAVEAVEIQRPVTVAANTARSSIPGLGGGVFAPA